MMFVGSFNTFKLLNVCCNQNRRCQHNIDAPVLTVDAHQRSCVLVTCRSVYKGDELVEIDNDKDDDKCQEDLTEKWIFDQDKMKLETTKTEISLPPQLTPRLELRAQSKHFFFKIPARSL